MAMTTTVESGGRTATERSTETGGVNAALQSQLTGRRRRVLGASIHYSGAPTAAASTLAIVSGGTKFVIASGAVNTQDQALVPATGSFVCLGADTIQTDSPAGGAGITASVLLITEPVA